jgi:hypothetical protein
MYSCDLFWYVPETRLANTERKSVAKQRIVNTKFWDDSYIVRLNPTEKLLFLYLISNPLTNIAGVYELPLRRVAFDTGVAAEKIESTFKRLEKDGKIVVASGWLGIVNFIKHQSLNPKIKQGILTELRRAPMEITDRLSIDYQRLCIESDRLSHSNSNLNTNTNSNALPLGQLTTALPQDIQNRRKELIRKWRA